MFNQASFKKKLKIYINIGISNRNIFQKNLKRIVEFKYVIAKIIYRLYERLKSTTQI